MIVKEGSSLPFCEIQSAGCVFGIGTLTNICIQICGENLNRARNLLYFCFMSAFDSLHCVCKHDLYNVYIQLYNYLYNVLYSE